MLRFIKKNHIPLTVFITGGCVLVVEVVAVRILSPFFGSTIYTVSSVISIILAALSLGYYYGGKISEANPTKTKFYFIIFLSGVALIATHLIGKILLPILSYNLPLTYGPLLFAALLFFLPAFLMGLLSPYAVKLQSLDRSRGGVGAIAGTLFFWSTLGSILGSILTGFFFIPSFGIDAIVITTGAILIILGLVPAILLKKADKKTKYILFSITVFMTVVLMADKQFKYHDLFRKDGVYEELRVYDEKKGERPVRYFQQDRSRSGAIYLDSEDPKDLVYNYTKYYSLYKILPQEPKKILVIGAGVYSIPKAIHSDLPQADIDVAEIEPGLENLAIKYFRLEKSPQIHTFTQDGRRVLADKKGHYDMIFSDVYYSLFSIPAHFTTKEFFQQAKDKLSKDGIFIANLVGDLHTGKPSLILSEIKTFRSVFANSYFFSVDSPGSSGLQNIIFAGFKNEKKIDFRDDFFVSHLVDVNKYNLSDHQIFTDNFAPVEYYTSQALKRVSTK